MKILIFTPIYQAKDYCVDRFYENLQLTTYKGFDHYFVTNDKTEDYANDLRKRFPQSKVVWTGRGGTTREALARSQEYIRHIAIKENYDYLVSLESDIFPQPNWLAKLLSSGIDVISGLYFIGNFEQGVSIPCATKFHMNKQLGVMGTTLLKTHEEIVAFCNGDLQQVAAAGMGCCLISRRVFEKIPFMYEPDMGGHSDIFWFNDCARQKIPVLVDTSVFCVHEFSDWGKVADR